MGHTTISPQTLAHHLRVAAERYEADAAVCTEPGAVNDGGRLAAQFKSQAQEARSWADAFEQGYQFSRSKDDDLVVLHDAPSHEEVERCR